MSKNGGNTTRRGPLETIGGTVLQALGRVRLHPHSVLVTRALTAPTLWLALIATDGRVALGRTQDCPGQTVVTRTGAVCGKIQSVEGRALNAYLGIPYAESTAGANRWRPPVLKAAWTGVRPALEYGNACPSPRAPEGSPPQSEDCLSLNVWTPSSAPGSKLPVLVFIHGGAFVFGSSAAPAPGDPQGRLYDGSFLTATQNVVVVSLNYRLGALGFLAGVVGLRGNYGLMDQQLALEWVRDNIAAFGGDPSRVTLSGESAGAMSVGLHALSAPRSVPLFAQAIMESNPIGLPYRTLDEAARVGQYYMVALGCWFRLNPLGCLRSKTVAELLMAQRSSLVALPILEFGLYSLVTWSPVVDGEVITASPLEAAFDGKLTKPMLMGTNADETEPFLAAARNPVGALGYQSALATIFGQSAYLPILAAYPFDRSHDNRAQLTRLTADCFFTCANRFVASSAKGPIYLYEFSHGRGVGLWPEVASCLDRACHGNELPYVFHTPGKAGFTPQEDRLSRAMADAWGRFVRSGNPAGGDLEWPEFRAGGQRLELDLTPSVGRPSEANCAFWDRMGYGNFGLKSR
jgi:carboxylesterase type B